MKSTVEPWDQRIARALVRPLANTPVTPNHITAFSIALCLFGSVLLATGEPSMTYWGAGVFVLGRFLDHFDGELARLTGKKSRFGYYFDYAAGGISYVALFLCLGIGASKSPLGGWAIALGLTGAMAAIISLFLNLGIDQANEDIAEDEGEAVGYPSIAGFELEDGIYLLAPITWLGFLQPFFVAAGIGASFYCLWTLWRLVGLRNRIP